jgi:hypothetical protein
MRPVGAFGDVSATPAAHFVHVHDPAAFAPEVATKNRVNLLM